MDYNVEDIRALAERWLAAETTLAEEQALRKWFADTREELPVDLKPIGSMFGQSAEAAGERSHRKLILHTEPSHRTVSRQLRRWIPAVSAAAILVAMLAIFTPGPAPQSDILCVVNGVRITDPDQIAAHTLEALEIADDNLKKPGEALSSELGSDPALVRVGEMLNELSKNQ